MHADLGCPPLEQIGAARVPLDEINRDLKLVVIDCAYDTIYNEETQRLLGKVARLKIEAYRTAYPYGILPVSSSRACRRMPRPCRAGRTSSASSGVEA